MSEEIDVTMNLEHFAKAFAETIFDSPGLLKVLDDRVKATFEKFKPQAYEIVELTTITRVEGARKELVDCVQALKLGMNIMIVGPAGSGKTTLTRQIADMLEVAWLPISCNPELTSSALLGRMMPDGNAGARYVPGPFLHGYENGGCVTLEEFDASDPSILLVLNTAIDSDTLPVPNRGDNPVAKRHKDFYLILDANTFGDGASREYVGRMQQDAAFLDRFVGSTFFLDYDDELEQRLSGQYKKYGNEVYLFVKELRKKARETQMRRVVSTRLVIRLCQWTEAGIPPKKAVERCLIHWSDAERTKLDVDAIVLNTFH